MKISQNSAQTISLENGTLQIDGAKVGPVQEVRLYRCGQNEMVTLPSWHLLEDRFFLEQIWDQAHSSRINFFSPDLAESIPYLKEYSADTFSFFVVFGDKNRRNPFELDFNVQDLTEVCTDVLSQESIDVLMRFWQQDYIDTILQGYSQKIKERQRKSMQERLLEGGHRLYLQENRILGHGCWVPDIQSITGTHCLYFHQWIRLGTQKEYRKTIHQRFFRVLFSQSSLPMSGVAIANQHSLKHLMKNGINPVFLSMKRG